MSAKQLNSSTTGNTVGAQLAQAREAAGISEREVSDALNLPVATIRAIESDDHSDLPAPVFSRGYIRTYAKYLELDPEALMSALPDVDDQAEEEPAPGSQGSPSQASLDLVAMLQPKFLGLMAAVVLAVLVVLLWPSQGDEPEVQATGVASNPVDADQAATQPTTQSVSGSTEEASTVSQQAPVSAEIDVQREADESDLSEQLDATSQPVDEPPVTPTAITQEQTGQEVSPQQIDAPSVAAADTARRLTPAGEDRLGLEFTEECWVEIKSKDGELLYANLGKPGGQMNFVGTAPYRVLLGYAPGALLRFNGEPVALAPHTRNNVASLVVGQ